MFHFCWFIFYFRFCENILIFYDVYKIPKLAQPTHIIYYEYRSVHHEDTQSKLNAFTLPNEKDAFGYFIKSASIFKKIFSLLFFSSDNWCK